MGKVSVFFSAQYKSVKQAHDLLLLQGCLFGSFSPSMLLALLQLPQDPRLALTLPDELLESEPDSHCRRRSGHLRLGLLKHVPVFV